MFGRCFFDTPEWEELSQEEKEKRWNKRKKENEEAVEREIFGKEYIGDRSEMALYSYSGENWNDDTSVSGDIDLLDGFFIIYKKCLEEPEIYIKTKKMPSGKNNTFEKRIVHTSSIEKHIADGNIVVDKKCKNEFRRFSTGNVECYIAHLLLVKIFEDYQRDATLPEQEAFIQ